MPLIQLQPHPFTSLPSHPSLPANPSRPDLKQYTSTALHEALEHLTSLPTSYKTDPKLRPSPPSQTKVKLLRAWRTPSKQSSGADDKPEFWVARQSEHVDAAGKGTASWSEFEAGLREDHAEHEMEYTPSVASVERLLEWKGDEIGEVEVDGVKFRDVVVEVNLITHTFNPSFLISPRSFISLTISAAFNSPNEGPESQPGQNQKASLGGFLTVQIPLSAAPSTTPEALRQNITSVVPRKTVFAHYASIERVTLLSTASTASEPPSSSRSIEWTMATTSNAGGSIPQSVQRSWALGGVPKAVVADVGLFIGWTMRRRQSS